MNALKRFLFLTKLVIITLSSIHCMGDSKVTIYRLDTDCNKKSFDIGKKLYSEGRVHYLLNGDYSENSEIDKLIKQFISLKK
jgi:hypothetical protein